MKYMFKAKKTAKISLSGSNINFYVDDYSTVTDFARFLGWSTLQPLITAMW